MPLMWTQAQVQNVNDCFDAPVIHNNFSPILLTMLYFLHNLLHCLPNLLYCSRYCSISHDIAILLTILLYCSRYCSIAHNTSLLLSSCIHRVYCSIFIRRVSISTCAALALAWIHKFAGSAITCPIPGSNQRHYWMLWLRWACCAPIHLTPHKIP
jgi:hypothetical protein